MVEFRQHLQGVFDQVCLGLNRKIGSLDQFTKFIKARAQITTDYAKALEKLAAKPPSVFFEESGISRAIEKLVATEAEEAKHHAELAECLHERVYKELIFTRDTMDKLRRTIENDGTIARKQFHDALIAMKRAKENYMKTCRELEMNEWFQKDEASSTTVQQQQKREKKVAKLRQDLQEATDAYKQSVEEATRVQNEYFQKRLPSSLDSLQRVFRQRASKIHDSIRDYCIQSTSTLNQCLPVLGELEKTVDSFNIQNELEEYITKTETFFWTPEDPKFEQFVRTPEGQVPPSVAAQQKTLYNKFHSALRGTEKKQAGAGVESEGTAADVVKYAPTTGIFGKSVQQLMEQQKSQYPRLQVPYILVFLADAIIRQDGQHSDGIFRLSGALPSMDKVKARLNAGDYVEPSDVHDASGLFKYFLRSLPDPLVPTDLYDAAINEPPNCHDVFSKIPEPNKTIAGFVVRFIHDYFLDPKIVEVTLMTPDNLATVLFPCLIRNPSSDLLEIVRHVEAEKTWMRKSFTALDVSSFPSLDQCREQAGLNGKNPPPSSANPAPNASDAKSPSSIASEIPGEKPKNPPPMPKKEEDALPMKPMTAAPTAPPTSLPTAALSGVDPHMSGAAPTLTLDFSSLSFDSSGSGMVQLPDVHSQPPPSLPASFNLSLPPTTTGVDHVSPTTSSPSGGALPQ